MFFYLIHNSPLWKNLENGKRNVKTFITGMICYILLHAYMYSEYDSKNKIIEILRNYIWYIILADCAAMGVTYKLFYGRSILNELSPRAEDIYDEKTHKCIKKEDDIIKTTVLPHQSLEEENVEQNLNKIQLNKPSNKNDGNKISDDEDFDHELKKQIKLNKDEIESNEQKIKNMMMKSEKLYKNVDLIDQSDESDKHNLDYSNSIDKDYYREKMKQIIPKNEKRFNPNQNLQMMEQMHMKTSTIHPSEIKMMMEENYRTEDPNQLKMIQKAITNYSGVNNFPQDMTNHILDIAGRDMETELANNAEMNSTNQKTRSSLMCHLPIHGSDIGLDIENYNDQFKKKRKHGKKKKML